MIDNKPVTFLLTIDKNIIYYQLIFKKKNNSIESYIAENFLHNSWLLIVEIVNESF